ncbi:MAG: hypothetical protein HQK81_05920 [Desulfovibrionaceae bacterium]|nr:hypothetical protein [Desulfovibrionaceae bacterium]MBF0513586.1 hypothetical protein [Desulfovibrionaceae bacterium]
MSDMQISGCAKAASLSLAVTCVLSGLLVFLKELNKGVFAFMKTVTVHHWVTHGLFDVAVFFLLAFLLGKMRGGQGPAIGDRATINILIGGVAAGVALVIVFYGFVD